jgi:hypothetical protein
MVELPGKHLEITPELLESIKALAYTGLSQDEIAVSLGRARTTLFFRSEEKDSAPLKAYNEGKKANKLKLLKDIEELGDTSKSDEVRFKAKKFDLAIKHKMVETQKAEVDANVTGSINLNITKQV